MTIQALREFVGRHSASVAGLAALGAALDARTTGVPLEPALAGRVQDLLAALGAGDALEGASAEDVAPVLALLRVTLRINSKLLFADTRAAVWSHTEPELLTAAGEVSVGFAKALTGMVVPALEGLSERLGSPSAAFLDVGVGVGKLSIALARLLPELRIVGIDPWQPSLALARKNVDDAGLGDRIQLREQAAEDLGDEAAFDLGWLPTTFMPARAIPTACERVHRALRPGGWLLFAIANPGPDATSAALSRLFTTFCGGSVMTTSEVEGLLRETGLVEVRALPAQPGSPVMLVVGRRKPA